MPTFIDAYIDSLDESPGNDSDRATLLALASEAGANGLLTAIHAATPAHVHNVSLLLDFLAFAAETDVEDYAD